MNMTVRLGLAAICAVIFALPVAAHHSHGNYVDTFSDLEGVVSEIHFVVPHSWVYLEVANPDGGEPRIWALEATGRAGLERLGINREYIKPGDNIKVRCHVLRDGTNGCLLGFLRASDGSVKDWDGRADTPIPADF
jgi:hypothetical protein